MYNKFLCSGLIFFLLSCAQEADLQIYLQQSETFLLNNAIKDKVILMEEGLQYVVIESGDINASPPELSDTITAHFHGTLMDGTVFWSSVDMGEPLTIQLSQLISGCQKVISKMKVGDLWRVFIHPSLAYGEEGRPTIPPNSTLIFDIELINVDR
jgi:FKBP-type peptidyl-prolyl cis-trans isomerase